MISGTTDPIGMKKPLNVGLAIKNHGTYRTTSSNRAKGGRVCKVKKFLLYADEVAGNS